MNRGTKIYLAVISVITILVVIWGVAFNVGGFFGFNRGRHCGVRSSKTVSDTITITEEVKSLNIAFDMSDIYVKTGDNFAVDYCLPKYLEPQVSVDGGVLNIKTPSDRGIGFIPDFHEDYYFNITIPSDARFDSVNLELDLGNLEIEKLDCQQFTSELNAGNIEIDTISADSVELVADMGNVTLSNAVFERGSAKCDMGNIEVAGDFAKFSANCDMGNINLTNKNDKADYDLDCDMGNIEINGVSLSH